MRHMAMADELGEDPVRVELKRGRHWYELTLVTRDRPFLFAKLAGVLAAWGMNIVERQTRSRNRSGNRESTRFYFWRPLPNPGTESVGMGSLPSQRNQRPSRRGRPG